MIDLFIMYTVSS